MPVNGELTNKFNRVYVYLNPDPFLGPYTQRLSNLIPVTDLGGDIDNLYAIPPIVSTESSTTAHLTFNIDAIPKTIWDSKGDFTQKQLADNYIKYAPFKSERAIRNVSSITSVAPVSSNQSGRDAIVWFDITNLPNIDAARSKQKMRVVLNLSYNSRSITAITASAPLEAITTGNVANVTFDMTSLPPA